MNAEKLTAMIFCDVAGARNANRTALTLRRQWPERPEAAQSARDYRDASMRAARKHREELRALRGDA